MVISRSQLEKQLVPGLNAITGLSYKEVTDEHKYLFEQESSNRAFEEETHMSLFGEAVEKPEGAGITYDDARELFTARYQHDTMGLAFAITYEAYEDNLYETQSKLKAKALGRSLASAKEQKAADVFNKGFDPTVVGGDNQPLFSNNHPTMSSDFDNLSATDLSETALEDDVTKITLFEDDRGILINAQPKYIVVPPQLKWQIGKILKSELTTTPTTFGTDGITNANDVNMIKNSAAIPGGYYCNHRLTANDAYFIKTDNPNGTKMFSRRKLTTNMEGDFDTDNMRYKATERYSFGWTDPRGWLASEGAA